MSSALTTKELDQDLPTDIPGLNLGQRQIPDLIAPSGAGNELAPDSWSLSAQKAKAFAHLQAPGWKLRDYRNGAMATTKVIKLGLLFQSERLLRDPGTSRERPLCGTKVVQTLHVINGEAEAQDGKVAFLGS